jgi:hypothetical protein
MKDVMLQIQQSLLMTGLGNYGKINFKDKNSILLTHCCSPELIYVSQLDLILVSGLFCADCD